MVSELEKGLSPSNGGSGDELNLWEPKFEIPQSFLNWSWLLVDLLAFHVFGLSYREKKGLELGFYLPFLSEKNPFPSLKSLKIQFLGSSQNSC